MPKTDGLTEKQKIFNESNFPLIQLYLDGFIAGVNAFCESDQNGFQIHKRTVITTTAEIAQKFNLKTEDVCRFANEYHELTHLINGIFTRKEDDHLYFIKGGDFIKIGRTRDPKTRLGSLQVASTERLEYIKIFKYRGCYEFKIHDIFDYLRVRGEWFEDHSDIRDFILLLSQKNSEATGIYGI